MQVTFFLDDPELERLRGLDPDRDWRELQRGERAWVLQTWLRLAQAGYPARLAATLPAAGLVVFHSKQRQVVERLVDAESAPRGRRAGRQAGGAAASGRGAGGGDVGSEARVLVGIRGDLKAAAVADFEVVQNARTADGRRSFFVPHWPQPGLLPRDPARGATVARAAYKGFDRNLHPYFRSAAWRHFLAARGIDWVVDSVAFAERATRSDALEWPDFRDVDLVVAARPRRLGRGDTKPATKLSNAWLAGVPALLGPDVAFRELRQSPLDYLEIATPRQARQAVGRLLGDPALYLAMVDNGRRRAAGVTPEAVRRCWIDLLDRQLPAALPGLAAPGMGRWRRLLPWRR